jgi:formate dehydrogenase subunit beta
MVSAFHAKRFQPNKEMTMDAYWKLDTHGDPLGTISHFIQALWKAENLDYLIVEPNGHGYLLESPDQAPQANPFRPMMKTNLASLVVDTLKAHPGKRIGVILRSCELRALNQLAWHGALKKEDLLTICVDCLGTYALDEFGWRTDRLALTRDITEETLRFAPQGGIAAYRYRPACQICSNPGAKEADINLCVIGLPVREEILVGTRNGAARLKDLTAGVADPALVDRRIKMLERLVERHQHTRANMIVSLEDTLPSDIYELLDEFESCSACQACMDACPICTVDYPRRGEDGKFLEADMVNWLISCSGCGMCEQNCPRELPLVSVFNRIRDQLELDLII